MSFILTDESKFLWGKIHKGKKLKDVPASYLLWILDTWDSIPLRLHTYLVANQDALLMDQGDEDEMTSHPGHPSNYGDN